jgi:hypothetical protein
MLPRGAKQAEMTRLVVPVETKRKLIAKVRVVPLRPPMLAKEHSSRNATVALDLSKL